MQQDDELAYSLKVNVLAMNPKVEPQAASHRRYGDPCDHRQTVVTVPTVLERCLSFGGPRATHNGLEQIAALVYQHDRLAIVAGLFNLGPTLGAPRGNGFLIPLPRPALRLLGTPAHSGENVPDVPRMVSHPKLPLDHQRDPLQSPQIGRETGRLCTLQQDTCQFGGLPLECLQIMRYRGGIL